MLSRVQIPVPTTLRNGSNQLRTSTPKFAVLLLMTRLGAANSTDWMAGFLWLLPLQYDYSALLLNASSLVRRAVPNPNKPERPEYKVPSLLGVVHPAIMNGFHSAIVGPLKSTSGKHIFVRGTRWRSCALHIGSVCCINIAEDRMRA